MRHPLRSTATIGVGGLASLIAVTAGQCAPSTDPSRAEPTVTVRSIPSATFVPGGDTAPTGSHRVEPTTTIVHRPPSDDTSGEAERPVPTEAPAPTTAAPVVPVADSAALPPVVAAPPASGSTVDTAPPPTDAVVVTDPPPGSTNEAPATSPTEPPSTPAPPPPGSTSEAVALANRERVAAGLTPLTADGGLADAARSHSMDQATMQSTTHTGSDSSSPEDRVARSGFDATSLAENVAAGYGTPAAVIEGWMGSAPHRANLLNPAFTAIGVASAQAGDGTLYWTMVLAG